MAVLGDRGPFLGGADLTVPGAGGVPIAATAWGRTTAAGPTPVVLLHGLSQQRRFWGPVARRLSADSPSASPLVALDLRGHGDSGGGLDDAYDITTCADDVLAVLDALGWDRAVTVGHSWGAAVSLAVAARAPGRITAAVAIDGGIVGPGELGPRAQVRERLTPPRLGIAEADLVPMLRSGSLADWWNDEVEAALLPTFEVGDDGLVRTRIGFDRHLAVLDGLLDHDHEAVLSAVECPAWVVSCEPRAEIGDSHHGEEWQRAREAGMARGRAAAGTPTVAALVRRRPRRTLAVAGARRRPDPFRRRGGGRRPVIEFETLPDLTDPVMIAAFEGWNDAGDAASGAVSHLATVWQSRPLAELDPEDYYDYQVNRPMVSLDEEGIRQITWPTTRLSLARIPAGTRDAVLVHGIEPNMRWQQYVRELLGLAGELGVTQVVTIGALLSDSPHTRPVPVSGSTSEPGLARSLGLEPSTYEGPTGIVGVMQDGARRFGIPAVSLWAAVPHYVAQPPCPKATLALIRRVEDLLDVSVPLGDLVEDARAWEIGVDELAAEDEEVAEYVRQLERARDTSDLPEASGEAIAREFERYLRRRDPGGG